MANFMEVLQTRSRSQNSSTIAYIGSLVISAIFLCWAAIKEVQRMIGTINDGTLHLLGPLRL